MTSVGINKDYHSSPYGQFGGLSTFPTAGVVSGLELALAGTAGVNTDTTKCQFTISAGVARFDGVMAKAASNLSVIIDAGVDLATTDTIVQVYLNPPRQVPVFTSVEPDVGETGDYALKVSLAGSDVIAGPYYVVDTIYIVKDAAWVKADPFAGEIPYGSGWNNAPFNKVMTTLTASNVALANEYPVFLRNELPPHIPGNQAMVRQSGGILLGEVSYVDGAGTITSGLPDYHRLAV